MVRKLRRFKFSGLPKLSKAQVTLTNALLAHLPQTPFERGFKDALREVLEPLVHVDIDLWLDTVQTIEPGHLWKHVNEPSCIAIIATPPKSHQILLEVDLPLAQLAIDRMLGGAAEDVDAQRPLSEIEEGVFSFILLKVLQFLQRHVAEEHQVALRLNGLASGRDTLSPRIELDQPYVQLAFKFFFDLEIGFLKLYLPSALVTGAFAEVNPEPGPALSRYLRRVRDLTPRLAGSRAPLAVELGRIPFSLGDLHEIEPGDIVLIEDANFQLAEGCVTGPVTAHVGKGAHGTLQGSVKVGDSGRYEMTIDEILAIGTPSADGHISDNGTMDEEYAMRLAAPHDDARDFAQRLRDAAAKRAAQGTPTPLWGAAGGEASLREEHSDSEYEEEYEADGYEDVEEEEPLTESVGMLQDVAVSMVVELGRVMVSASDIVSLRPGQVVELARAPGDPVDLVIDDKRIGRGELVEIEGELGVRILDLVK